MAAEAKVVVIGAGVIGVGAALAIQRELPRATVTIVTAQLTPLTTGDGAAGIWGPHYVSGDPIKIRDWSQATHDFLQRLWMEGECPGIGLIAGHDHPEKALHTTVPFYHEDAPASGDASAPEEGKMGSSGSAARMFESSSDGKKMTESSQSGKLSTETPVSGKDKIHPELRSTPYEGKLSQQVTFYAEPSKFLPFLLSAFKYHGGNVIVANVTSLQQLAEYDVIINCTGLGSETLFGDTTLQPIRGQLVRVKAPYVKSFLARNGFYIVPNEDAVVLGGTAQLNDRRTEPDIADTARIVAGCSKLIPALRGAPIVGVWVGLRPFRPGGVRLESERHLVAGRWRWVVHNYGHGGSGVTLFWGCALEVAARVREILENVTASKL
ncbi:D-amino-acid oxidase-like [Amphibalanus amphitrite]|uniref:D-amino-acid oxidase-like n=1 Tax=Amphibalanus amphitrite TaxID=1232801 RepID=UPI001C91BE09|nr:D-amino-acid oxidase-like [Amphibalanus amphitrite]XP_043199998.1 D-amino-acid oxidase-like [Amphibalanus amphitrite]XP_043199999.1 D-amino-acid oxidase-like [Amphibalanus amphitrite]